MRYLLSLIFLFNTILVAQSPLLTLMNDNGVSYKAETISYISRVEADGGEIINVEAVNNVFLSGIDSVTLWGGASYGIQKDVNDKIIVVYDLFNNIDMYPNIYLTANAPTYVEDKINGLPSLTFAGNPEKLFYHNLTLSTILQNTKGTFSFIIKQTGTATQNGIYMEAVPDNTNQIGGYATYSGGIYFDYGSEGGGGRVSVAQPIGWDDAYHILQFVRNDATAEIWVDGIKILDSSFSDDLDNSQTGDFYLGFNTGVYFIGDICEYVITNGVNDAPKIRTFLNSKYSVY